jgi:hypothetical protein
MIEGGGSKNNETKSNDNTENKASAPEKLYQELAKVANKLYDMLFDGDNTEKSKGNEETKNSDAQDKSSKETAEEKKVEETNETSSNKTADLLSKSISELMNRLFSDDLSEGKNDTDESKDNDSSNEGKDTKESDVEKKDPILEKVEKMITTQEGIKALIEKHPEKAELWKKQLEAVDKLNDPDASDAEVNSANRTLSKLKGQLLEYAVKDALSDVGFDVESQQRVVEGEKGGTKPDVIAKNNTDHPIEVFGITIQPGETLSGECKCGGRAYLANELKNHIPNQLSGQEGTKMLLTTSDIKRTPAGLVQSVCGSYEAKLVTLDVSATDAENAIKEVKF